MVGNGRELALGARSRKFLTGMSSGPRPMQYIRKTWTNAGARAIMKETAWHTVFELRRVVPGMLLVIEGLYKGVNEALSEN